MSSTIKPLDSQFECWYYDGQRPVRHEGILELAEAGLQFSGNETESLLWTYSDIQVVSDGAYREPVRIEKRAGAVGETLAIARTDFLEALAQHAPDLVHDDWPDLHLSGWPAVLLCCIAVAALGSFFYFWGVHWIAETAARFTPVPVEERLGQAVANILAPVQIRCGSGPRQQTLDRVANRVIAVAGSKYRFRIIYVNASIVNAFAAPGGYIVVYQGLLDQTETPEEFAGVLAHEIQHVLHKHSTRAIAREMSGRTLLALMAGDAGGTPVALDAAAKLVNLHYQRSDEDEADRGSVPLLAKANIRPDGLLTFLRRLQGNPALSEPSIKYLSSHPAMPERTAQLEAQAHVATGGRPLMTREEWLKTRDVCAPGP